MIIYYYSCTILLSHFFAESGSVLNREPTKLLRDLLHFVKTLSLNVMLMKNPFFFLVFQCLRDCKVYLQCWSRESDSDGKFQCGRRIQYSLESNC